MLEHQGEKGLQWAASESIAVKVTDRLASENGVGTASRRACSSTTRWWNASLDGDETSDWSA
ncbi:hypothetical protein NEH60_03900 [Xanthomonas hortorum pv. pelargonii]|uniref:hypothetical protein n=1 Tax=Xanthomonas hortorum TaxID=56454 RepID=UPI002042EDEA|nr:hypothetical protein [Xanthomonas hortorum]MCM5547976.1 hypothetical protein [Xanthomonas hortorum pv. pelargonii]UXN00207.1 hypothetical protein N8D55_22275 [Xanthomonas hortorum pv. pelargonii]